ncbi:MAG: S-layer homology domain-containing protein [Oscillospiraceae bacterium]|nr:S-layer homology domain-containing protein [Oscillospiraceae bacterium]
MKTRRFLAVLLAVLMVVTLFPAVAFATEDTAIEAQSVPADWLPPSNANITRRVSHWWPNLDLDVDISLLPPGIDINLGIQWNMFVHLTELAALSLLPGRQSMVIYVENDINMPTFAPPALVPRNTTLILRGVGNEPVTIRNLGFLEHFIVAPGDALARGGTLVLENVILCGGEYIEPGARHGGVRVIGSVFAEVLGVGGPGRLYMGAGSTIQNSAARGGVITGRGGGVYLEGGGLLDTGGLLSQRRGGILTMLPGSAIMNNSAARGGGVYAGTNAWIRMAGGVIANNEALPYGRIGTAYGTGTGGGVHLSDDATFDMVGGIIENNTAVYGGGVRAVGNTRFYNTVFNMSGGEIRNNEALSSPAFFPNMPARGGGVRICANADFNMSGGRIHNNSSDHGGGGVSIGYHSLFTPSLISLLNRGGRMEMTGGQIDNNEAAHSGGGVRISAGAHISTIFEEPILRMRGGVISNNEAPEGGGLWLQYNTRFHMGRELDWLGRPDTRLPLPVIRDNEADRRGGGIFVGSFADLYILEGYLIDNHAGREGGAIFAQRRTYGPIINLITPLCFPDLRRIDNDRTGFLQLIPPFTVGARFDGNTAGRGAFMPPVNAHIPYIGIGHRVPNSVSVSPDGVSHALNNFDINYIGRVRADGTPAPEFAEVEFMYNYESAVNYGIFDADLAFVGELLDEPHSDPVRDGYIFKGWYFDANTENAFDFDVPVEAEWIRTRQVDRDGEIFNERYFQLFARWEEIPMADVVFLWNYEVADDKDEAFYETTIVLGQYLALPTTGNPEREGYTFEGWYLDPDGDDAKDFELPATAEMLSDEGTLRIYARWEEEPVGPEPYFHSWFMQGNEHGQFNPHGIITRGEVAAILVRTFAPNSDPTTPPISVFTDVNAADHWEAGYIAWAYYHDFVRGNTDAAGNQIFRPREPVTREELAAMVARAYGLDLTDTGTVDFPDADEITDWAYAYIYAVANQKWLRGDGAGLLRPTDDIERAEAAAVIARALGRYGSLNSASLVDVVNDLRRFPDVASTQWFYFLVIEVSHSHYFLMENVGTEDAPRYVERWTEITWPTGS